MATTRKSVNSRAQKNHRSFGIPNFSAIDRVALKKSANEALQQLRALDPVAFSKALRSCRVNELSLLRFEKIEGVRHVQLLGLNLTHPFTLKRKSLEVSPLVAKNWKVTLMNLQLKRQR